MALRSRISQWPVLNINVKWDTLKGTPLLKLQKNDNPAAVNYHYRIIKKAGFFTWVLTATGNTLEEIRMDWKTLTGSEP